MKHFLLAFISGSLLLGGICHFSGEAMAYHREAPTLAADYHLGEPEADQGCCDSGQTKLAPSQKDSVKTGGRDLHLALAPAGDWPLPALRISPSFLKHSLSPQPFSLTGHVIKRE